MNNLQKLLRLRKVSVLQLSEEIGIGYHTVQKCVKSLPQRNHRATQEAVAEWLGLSLDQAFGPNAERYLSRHLEHAIRDRAERVTKRLLERYLPQKSSLADIGERRNVKKYK